MALTAQNQADIIFLLGWPGTTIAPGSVNYNPVVFDRLNDGLPDTMVSQAQGLLARVAALDTQLQAAPGRLVSTEVGDIKLNADEIAMVRKERGVILRDLARLLDIPLLKSGSNRSVMV